MSEENMKSKLKEIEKFVEKILPEFFEVLKKIQTKNFPNPTIDDIRKTAEEISNSSKTYDELCWLIAELDISTKK